jgi:hypothetical protein
VNGQIQYGPAASATSAPTPAGHRQRRSTDPSRFTEITAGSRRALILVTGSALLVVTLAAVPRQFPDLALLTAIGTAWLTLTLVALLPGPRERAGEELARRLAELRHALNAVGDQPTRGQLEGLLQFARGLELQDEEIDVELASIRASLAAIALREQLASAPPPVLSGAGPYSPDDPCHFTCTARLGRRRSDAPGSLLLTGRALRFRGTDDLSIPWSEIQQVQRSGHEVIVISHDQWRLLRFDCAALDEAAMASVMADHLRVMAAAAPC